MRLVPRFSLRFVWLTLTFFLIVFGLGVKCWRKYQEHERVASQLVALGNKVEEENDLLFGLVIGKRITGLQFLARGTSRESIALLTELPNPESLRRLTLCLYPENYFVEQDFESHLFAYEAITAVARCSALEQLDLRMDIKEGVLVPLRALKKLKSLNLYECRISPNQLAPLLSAFVELEVLRIDGNLADLDLNWSELFDLRLPKLKELSLSFGEMIQNLPLTKQGLGRFKELEYLTLHHVMIKNVEFEAGALPKLKYLDLSEAGGFEACEIDWKILPQVAPQLEGLDIYPGQINSETIKIIANMPNLMHIHLLGDYSIESLQEKLLNDQSPYPSEYMAVENFAELMFYCNHLQFHSCTSDIWKAVSPPEKQIQIPSWPSWDSDHWRGKR